MSSGTEYRAPFDFRLGNIALPILQDFYDRVCPKGVNRQDVTGLIHRLLTSYFSNPDNIRNEALKDRVYRRDETTGILIESVGHFRPELAEKRPAILIRPGEWKTVDIGLQNQMINADVYQPTTEYILIVEGTHNIITVSKNPAETEILADEVFKFLNVLRIVIPSVTPISLFRVLGISEPKAIPEQRTHFYCVLPVRYQIQQIFTINFQTSS